MVLHTLHRYITRDFLVIFAMTLAVFTFVLYIGAVIQAIDLMARGVAAQVILKIFLHNIPYILSFSIPISILTAILLLFSRLSLDGEITAMRASGQAMTQICAPILGCAVVFSLACLYINAFASPNSHFARRQLKNSVGIQNPLDLIEEGRFVRDFPGTQIYVGTRKDTRIYDVVVHEIGLDGTVARNIRPESGVITDDKVNKAFKVTLYTVRIDEAQDHEDDEEYAYISADQYVETLPYSELLNNENIRKRTRDFTLPELLAGVYDVRIVYPNLDRQELLDKNRTSLLIETSKRLAMSFSCLAFTMIGIPLGIRSRRRESSVGVFISLAVVIVFYFFVIVAEALEDYPRLHPEAILWIPIFAAQWLGSRLMRMHD